MSSVFAFRVGNRAVAGRTLLEVPPGQPPPPGVQHHDRAEHELPYTPGDVLRAVPQPYERAQRGT
ncbi:hypothetical protein [Streptomyces sp. SID5789]|uniref:hypothetical protein n=1 Tax=Streptomyces sp. SID5789 TaxID=2690310 RepID=UPI00136927D0|nr:hypothetical protein [Streptomyces sp. SID5789]MZE75204.1 hypothetical protein [Streptomyces sp. SID5789]